MNKFVAKMLELGAELDKAVSQIEISMVINDAEILYRNHIEQLTIPVVSKSDSELLVCKGRCDHGYMDEFGNELFCSVKENNAN